jgi:acetyltransferase-like isoleucine patch superfamily enzyme
MTISNITLEKNVDIDPSSSINNVHIFNNTKIAKRCSIFGSPDNILVIKNDSYIGMNAIINGYAAKVQIGAHVSIAQNVNIMADSGPNASKEFQRIYPILIDEIEIGDHAWIGASTIIMPGVKLGRFCVVAANSFVNKSFPDFSIIGGSPAKLIRKLSAEEIAKITQ